MRVAIDTSVIAHALRRWLGQVGVAAMDIEPGSPWENGYAESFHGRLKTARHRG